MNGITRRGFINTALAVSGTTAFGMAGVQTPPAQSSKTVRVESDVIYAKGGDMDLRLDIHHPPAGTEKRMATIHFHGGGFGGGNKESLVDRVRPYAARGYVAITPQYRLSGQAKFPALVEDAKAAIRWTRANASRLGIDPQHIGVVGYSAGGYHALFSAGTQDRAEFEGSGGNPGVSTKVAVCIAYYPYEEPTANVMPPNSDAAALHRAAATTYIASGYPPTAIFQGSGDSATLIENSQKLFQQLRTAAVPVEFHMLEGLPHVFDNNPEFADVCAQLADLFIDRHVLNPRKITAATPNSKTAAPAGNNTREKQ